MITKLRWTDVILVWSALAILATPLTQPVARLLGRLPIGNRLRLSVR